VTPPVPYYGIVRDDPAHELLRSFAWRYLRRLASRGGRMFQQPVSPSRRRYLRFDTPESVSVYWSCGGRDDTSRVRNLSLGGLFIETREPGLLGAKTKLDFLVQEGQIRAEAVVRHASPGRGLGLKFTAVTDKDRPHLAALLNRLSHSS
jgi:hypothetical protein